MTLYEELRILCALNVQDELRKEEMQIASLSVRQSIIEATYQNEENHG